MLDENGHKILFSLHFWALKKIYKVLSFFAFYSFFIYILWDRLVNEEKDLNSLIFLPHNYYNARWYLAF